jgi:hypothetical protein
MAKTKDYTITAEQGQFLLGLLTQFRMPEKLGAKPFSAIERAAGERDALALYEALKSASPIMLNTHRRATMMFGPEENWTVNKDDQGLPTGGDIKSLTLEVLVSMSDQAVSGALWVLLFATHPESPFNHANPRVMCDLIWPLVHSIRRTKALQAELGLWNAASKNWGEEDEPPAPQYRFSDDTVKAMSVAEALKP